MTTESAKLSMLVTIHAEEHPELFNRLVVFSNKQRRSRELKRLATEGLLGFSKTSSPAVALINSATQDNRIDKNSNRNFSKINMSAQPSDVLLQPITDALEGLSM